MNAHRSSSHSPGLIHRRPGVESPIRTEKPLSRLERFSGLIIVISSKHIVYCKQIVYIFLLSRTRTSAAQRGCFNRPGRPVHTVTRNVALGPGRTGRRISRRTGPEADWRLSGERSVGGERVSVPRYRLTPGRAYPVRLHYCSRNERPARTGFGRASRTPGPQLDYNIKDAISAASSSPTEVSGLASPGRNTTPRARTGTSAGPPRSAGPTSTRPSARRSPASTRWRRRPASSASGSRRPWTSRTTSDRAVVSRSLTVPGAPRARREDRERRDG